MSNSSDPKALAAEAAAKIAELTGVATHDIALTLGSGWGKSADVLGETVAVIDAAEVQCWINAVGPAPDRVLLRHWLCRQVPEYVFRD